MDLSNEAQLLLRCLRAEPTAEDENFVAQQSPECWHAALTLARRQFCSAYLSYRLAHNGLAPRVPALIFNQLQKETYVSAVRNLQLQNEVEQIINLVSQQDIPLVLLKGAHLAFSVYPSPALRFMGDLDLLVPRDSLMRVAQLIQQIGYQPNSRLVHEEVYFQTHQHLPRFIKEKTFVVELHWAVTTPGNSYSINLDEIWAHTVPVQIGKQTALSLCPESLLLHLCVHASYQHIFTVGIRNLIDIDMVLRRYRDSFDWNVFLQQVESGHCGRGVFLTLVIARQLFNCPLPQNILDALQPDDYAEHWVEQAIQMLFTSWNAYQRVSQSFTELTASPSLGAKLQIAINAIFLKPNIIALQYGVETDSPRLYLYYLVRLKDLVARYATKSLRWLRRDRLLQIPAKRHSDLLHWLTES